MTRADVARYLLMVLGWDGIEGETEVMADAVHRWHSTPGLSFADAYLAALASEQRCPIFSKNVRELSGQGVDIPVSLPTG
jgi:hypothetical protein